MGVSVKIDSFWLACCCCHEHEDLECYDGFWSHVYAMGRIFAGYGAIALEHLSALPCRPPISNVFAGLLDPGFEHLPPVPPVSCMVSTMTLGCMWKAHAQCREPGSRGPWQTGSSSTSGASQWLLSAQVVHHLGLTVICCRRVRWQIAPS